MKRNLFEELKEGLEFVQRKEKQVFEIEKNLPIPPPGGPRAEELPIPWEHMQVGDSVLIPLDGRPQSDYLMRAKVYERAKIEKRKYTTRKLSQTELRVWRIA